MAVNIYIGNSNPYLSNKNPNIKLDKLITNEEMSCIIKMNNSDTFFFFPKSLWQININKSKTIRFYYKLFIVLT